MTDHSRIDALRRRVEQDPASIAFAQLAEELRRVGQIEESVEICRAGLAIHPTYLSARVTLGRALIETADLDAAQREMEQVLAAAADNLAAIRALGDIHHRRGALDASLERYQTALELAPNDPDLEEIVAALARELAERSAAADATASAQAAAEPVSTDDVLEPTSLEPAALDASGPGTAAFDPAAFPRSAFDTPAFDAPMFGAPASGTPTDTPAFDATAFDPAVFEAFAAGPAAVDAPTSADRQMADGQQKADGSWLMADAEENSHLPSAISHSEMRTSALAVSFVSEPADADRDRLVRTVAALESWLDAINVARTVQRA